MFTLVSVFSTACALELPQAAQLSFVLCGPQASRIHCVPSLPNIRQKPVPQAHRPLKCQNAGLKLLHFLCPGRSWETGGISFACSTLSQEKGLWPGSPMNFPSGFTEATFTLPRGVGASELVSGYFTKGIGLWVVVSLAWGGRSEA